ncbi:uncharacterized protein LOC111391382 [Olea europaea var. sylvestris]|uniref:uncharacterized protein LOC111391382 n=1 Tax=Olea europaea var. sylvestris TaxID=158386 RepID=UPI000C1D1691|nr:uncharacterized protein LOC111391382 [Olea europaea var. sylvestris]
MWPKSPGVLWRDVLTENARKEFEDARFEKDLEIVAPLMFGGPDVCSQLLISLSRSKSSKFRMKAMNQIDVEVFWLGNLGFSKHFSDLSFPSQWYIHFWKSCC